MNYHGKAAKYYDIIQEPTFDYEAEALSLHRIFEEYSVRSVLDIACGTGSHLIHLAKLGYDCTGVDLSGDMLDIAKEKTLKEGLEIHFLQGDARTFKSEEKFDAAICLYVTSLLPSAEDVKKVLANMQPLLRSNGILVIDFMNMEFQPPGPPIPHGLLAILSFFEKLRNLVRRRKMEPSSAVTPPVLLPLLCDVRDFIQKDGLKIVRMNHCQRLAKNIEVWTALHFVEDHGWKKRGGRGGIAMTALHFVEDHGETSFYIQRQNQLLFSFDDARELVEENGFKIRFAYNGLANLEEFTGNKIDILIVARKH
jgi:ubiquinone/menaquinone biosynthesis C-methylase UbiE